MRVTSSNIFFSFLFFFTPEKVIGNKRNLLFVVVLLFNFISKSKITKCNYYSRTCKYN